MKIKDNITLEPPQNEIEGAEHKKTNEDEDFNTDSKSYSGTSSGESAMPFAFKEENENKSQATQPVKYKKKLSKRRYCFLKYYEAISRRTQDPNADKLRKAFQEKIIDKLADSNVLGKKWVQYIINGSNKPFIYAQRHMGLTEFLKALYCVCKNNNINCCLIDLNPNEDELNNFDKFYKWYQSISKMKESDTIAEIKKFIKNHDLSKSLYGYKKLYLIDNLDTALCDLFYKKKIKISKVIYFRKCWLKAIRSLNLETGCACIAGVLTHLVECREKATKVSYDGNLFSLYGQWNDHRHYLQDAFFSSLLDALHECQLQQDCECKDDLFCRFRIKKYKSSKQLYRKTLISKTLKLKKKAKPILDIVKPNYEKCGLNPHWLIMPIAHAHDQDISCSNTSNFDEHIKQYYRGDKSLQISREQEIILDFFYTMPLYLSDKCSLGEMEILIKQFSRWIENNLCSTAVNWDNVLLEVDSSYFRSPDLIKRMLCDSGAVLDEKLFHPFLRYIYSGEQIFNRH